MEIQDFGEKIGGAKKDLWKERGLSVEDLLDMNDAERIKLIKKDNIWKKPNYQQMVSDGLPVRVAFFIKTIRDATPTKPILYYSDISADVIEEKQTNYINFVGELRDYIMNISTENEILNFYDDFMSRYIIRSPNSYTVQLVDSAYGCIDDKLLRAARIRNLLSLDSEIKKKQFCYTEDEKILSNFDIFLFDNDKVKFITDYSNRKVIEITKEYGKRFIYPNNELSEPSLWTDNTFFITQNGRIIKNNLESIDEAEQYILSNFKENSKETAGTRKKKFTPKQLENITRNGEDYRADKNITGEDMMDTFNFKGGEFGNWLNENDRQQSLNYGYDAFMDLSKALSISPTDISFGNRLSIAFGSRGSGAALAHYEPDREVINLTKMKGAGSLAHEWGHALDDIAGKMLGYKGFITKNEYSTTVIKELVEAMKYKTVCNEETIKSQTDDYNKQVVRIKKYIDMLFPPEHLKPEDINTKDELVESIINNAEIYDKNVIEYISTGKGNPDIDKLSQLRKSTVGRVISKEDRNDIARLQNQVSYKKRCIGTPKKIHTNFYDNSIQFDDLYAKTENGYWQSTIEMFARAFACYVSDKLGNRSDYLCGHADLALGFGLNKNKELEIIKAFPEGEERTLINEKIDKLIEFLKEKNILHDYNLEKNQNDLDYDYGY